MATFSALAPKELSIKGALYGWAEIQNGQFLEAEAKFREAVSYCRAEGDPRCEMTNTINLGAAQYKLGKLTDARQSQEKALLEARQLGLPKFELAALVNLAQAEIALFRYDEAHEHAKAAAKLAELEDRQPLQGLALASEARALLAQGNTGAALTLAEHAEEILRQSWYHGLEDAFLAELLVNLGTVWRLLGACEQSTALNREAVGLLPEPLDLLRAWAYLGLARCEARAGRPLQDLKEIERARGDLESWKARTGASSTHVARDLDALLDAAAYEAERGLNPNGAPAANRTAYGFALLRQLDGENAEALRSLLAVPASSPDFGRAKELAGALAARVRIVKGGSLDIRESPTAEAVLLKSAEPGMWVEVLGSSGGWIKLRYLQWTGFAELGSGGSRLLEVDAAY